MNDNDYDADGDPLPSSEFRLAQQSIQNKLTKFKKDLLDKIKTNKPSCEPKIIDVPYLFLGNYFKTAGGVYNAESFFPNPTNGVRIGDKYIFSKLGNDVFDKYITDQYQKIGNKVDSIDTYFLHDHSGDLHCSTHVVRFCNPGKK